MLINLVRPSGRCLSSVVLLKDLSHTFITKTRENITHLKFFGIRTNPPPDINPWTKPPWTETPLAKNPPDKNPPEKTYEHKIYFTSINSHPNFWKFINILKREQSLNHVNISQARAGHQPEPQRLDGRYQDSNRRIKNIVQDYHNRDRLQYLRGLAHNISM